MRVAVPPHDGRTAVGEAAMRTYLRNLVFASVLVAGLCTAASPARAGGFFGMHIGSGGFGVTVGVEVCTGVGVGVLVGVDVIVGVGVIVGVLVGVAVGGTGVAVAGGR